MVTGASRSGRGCALATLPHGFPAGRSNTSIRAAPTRRATEMHRQTPSARIHRNVLERRGQSVSQLFHGPAPRSPLHRLSIRLRRSRSNSLT